MSNRRIGCAIVATAVVLVAMPASAQESVSASARIAARRGRVVTASRADARIILDGRLDEAAWRSAQPADSFVQRAPREGAPTSERTEVRILFDDDALYVGATLHDAHPDSILSVLGRRDGGTPSDEFFVALDSYHDRRTAFVFSVTPQGVQSDFRQSGDWQQDQNWNAVWESATRIDSVGWYAELRIPFSQLRFSSNDTSALSWGLQFTRWIARKGEESNWSLMPVNGPPLVSLYGELRGVRPGRSPRRMELVPYSLARMSRAPGERDNPLYRRTEPYATLGADVRYALTSNFTLSATVNPDFGQVEADPSEVNLTGFETFFPEQRPFFVEGADLTRYSIGSFLGGDEQLFYSRRIGRRPQLEVPEGTLYSDPLTASTILGAARLSGKTSRGWTVGALAAMTGAAETRYIDAARQARSHLVEPRTLYAVARVTRELNEGRSAVGAMLTTVRRDLRSEDARQALRGASTVGGFEARHRAFGDVIQLDAYAFGSWTTGTASAIDDIQRSTIHRMQRPDAPYLRYDPARTSLGGLAAGVGAYKMGGSPFRWGLRGRTITPAFDMNDLGFQRSADVVESVGWLGLNHSTPQGPFRGWWLFTNFGAQWNHGGERQTGLVNLYADGMFRNFWSTSVRVDRYAPSLSSALLRGGPSVAMPASTGIMFDVASDRRRSLSGGLNLTASRSDAIATRSFAVAPRLTLRAPAQLELSVAPSVSWNRNPWQYVTEVEAQGESRYIVADTRQTTTAIAIRANYTFSPTLTLQGYAQPFTSAGRFGALRLPGVPRGPRAAARFRTLPAEAVRASDGERALDLDADGTSDVAIGEPDFNNQELLANAVLRWEYRPGSALFVVWSQQRSADGGLAPFAPGEDARRLFAARPTNVVLVKVSYWLNR
jgi:hypothetical protein